MRNLPVSSIASVLVFLVAAAIRAENHPSTEENARVTLCVTKFRSIMQEEGMGFVNATTALAPHAAVTLVSRSGMPTLLVRRATKIEIEITAADASVSYRPLAVYFRPKLNGAKPRIDVDGKINFAHWVSPKGTLVIHDKYIHAGPDFNWEFFVIIQRVSDGEIGIVDPEIVNEN